MKRSRATAWINTALPRLATKILVLMFLFEVCPIAASATSKLSAAGGQTTAVDNAERFLETRARGMEIVKYVHSGADYLGHEYRITFPSKMEISLLFTASIGR